MLSSIFGYLTSNGTLAPGSAGVAEREAGVAELFARFASCSCSLLKLSSPCLGAMFASSWLLGDDVDVVMSVREHADRCSALSARESLNIWEQDGRCKESTGDIGGEEALDQLLIVASQRWMDRLVAQWRDVEERVMIHDLVEEEVAIR